jgi:small-conductance mechanosensitive channel
LQPEIPEIVRTSPLWARLAAIAGVLGIAVATFFITRGVGRRYRGKTAFGLQGLERLAGPLSLLAGLGATSIALGRSSRDPPLLAETVEAVAIFGAFWLAARAIDVGWATGVRSARLRALPIAQGALLVVRQFGRLFIFVGFVSVLAVRFGATEQLYLVLTGLAAALAFAARDPIRNAIAFASMVLDPPFHMGDQVRLGDFRGGEEASGEIVAITLTGTKIKTRRGTVVVVSNVVVGQLRVENLSAPDRRRLELELPVPERMATSELRAACDAIEGDLREKGYVSEARAPRVWISGLPGGLRVKASVWLRQTVHRREAQRDLVLTMRAQLESHAPG